MPGKIGMSYFGADLASEDPALFEDWLDQIGVYTVHASTSRSLKLSRCTGRASRRRFGTSQAQLCRCWLRVRSERRGPWQLRKRYTFPKQPNLSEGWTMQLFSLRVFSVSWLQAAEANMLARQAGRQAKGRQAAKQACRQPACQPQPAGQLARAPLPIWPVWAQVSLCPVRPRCSSSTTGTANPSRLLLHRKERYLPIYTYIVKPAGCTEALG